MKAAHKLWGMSALRVYPCPPKKKTSHSKSHERTFPVVLAAQKPWGMSASRVYPNPKKYNLKLDSGHEELLVVTISPDGTLGRRVHPRPFGALESFSKLVIVWQRTDHPKERINWDRNGSVNTSQCATSQAGLNLEFVCRRLWHRWRLELLQGAKR